MADGGRAGGLCVHPSDCCVSSWLWRQIQKVAAGKRAGASSARRLKPDTPFRQASRGSRTWGWSQGFSISALFQRADLKELNYSKRVLKQLCLVLSCLPSETCLAVRSDHYSLLRLVWLTSGCTNRIIFTPTDTECIECSSVCNRRIIVSTLTKSDPTSVEKVKNWCDQRTWKSLYLNHCVPAQLHFTWNSCSAQAST